jgi:succinoglycan biosynthesis protein ExoA
MDKQSRVTVIMPIRNEGRYITRALEAVLDQDYPHDQIELLVVDGMSSDSTREQVQTFATRDTRVQLIDNPEYIVPTALNRGIRMARGEIIIRVDGHAVVARDYVQRCVDCLSRVEADCVGGSITTVGENWTARGIAIAQSSPFGVGNAAFRYSNRAQYVDTLAFGAYRREVFDRVGLFDGELVRNQDDEFNFRLLRAGGRIWLDPSIRSTYYSRASLSGLGKQYFEYGFWKVRVIQKHRRPASWRHLVPITFVLVLFLSFGLSLFTQSPLWLLAVLLPYLLASLAVSLWLGSRYGWSVVPLLPLAFGTMHVAYGIGFMFGLVRFSFHRNVLPFALRQGERP